MVREINRNLSVAAASLNIAANFTAGEIRGVHVRVGQTITHGLQSRCLDLIMSGAVPFPIVFNVSA